MPRGWLAPRTSLTIRDYLLERGEAHPWEVWKYLKEKFKDYEHPPTPQSVAAILNAARKLGLVEVVREEESSKKAYYMRKIYRVVRPDAIEWTDPILALYKRKKFEATRYTEEWRREWGRRQSERMRERWRSRGKSEEL
jgi:hypothetical protein